MNIVSPEYVKSFVRRQKTDGNDAEAICTAARHPLEGNPAKDGKKA